MIQLKQNHLNFTRMCTTAFPFSVIPFYFVFTFHSSSTRSLSAQTNRNPYPPTHFHAFHSLMLCFSSQHIIFPNYFITFQALLLPFFYHLVSFPHFVHDNLYISTIHSYSTQQGHLGNSPFSPSLSLSQYLFFVSCTFIPSIWSNFFSTSKMFSEDKGSFCTDT